MWKKRAETTWERGVVVKLISKTSSCIRPITYSRKPQVNSPVYTAQINPGRTRVRPGLKLTQVVFTRHFSKLPGSNPGKWCLHNKLTPVEPGLAVFTLSLHRVNRANDFHVVISHSTVASWSVWCIITCNCTR